MGRDEEKDWQEEFERLREDPQFEEIRAKLVETIAEEQPDQEEIYNNDYRAFCHGFRRVKKVYFSSVNPVTVERTRRGDTDAAAELLQQMGVVGKTGFED